MYIGFQLVSYMFDFLLKNGDRQEAKKCGTGGAAALTFLIFKTKHFPVKLSFILYVYTI